jgi:hypothetical protein
VGRIAITTAIVIGALLAYCFLILALLGLGQDQTNETPLWLRNVETGAHVFQYAATGLGIIIGGIFAYYRFFKEDPYSERLQPSITAAVSRKSDSIFVRAAASVTNNGQTSVPLDMELTRVGLSARKIGVYDWTPCLIERIYVGQDHVRPGETISDQVWLETPDASYVALEIELLIAESEDLGWLTRDIVDLTQEVGNNNGALADDAESEGTIWSLLKAKARSVLTRKK